MSDTGMPQRAPDDADIATRLDRLPVTRLHAAVILVCALGLLFDVVEAALSNALSAVFSAAPHQVMPYQLSLLLASVFAGGAVGAPILGWFADRHGRRLALGTALTILTVTSLIAATSTDIAWLTFFRVLSGMALGAYPPLMTTYLSDVLPPKRRGMLILVGAAIGFLGAPAVIFLIRWLTPLEPFGLEGWRCALILGAIGSGIVAASFRYLPESPRWLVTTGQYAKAELVCRRFEKSAGLAPTAASQFDAVMAARNESEADSGCPPQTESFWGPAGRQHRLRALLLGALYFLSPWATIGFPLLSGAVLVEKGFKVSDSLLYLGLAMFGPTVGVLAAAFFIDRIERRTALALCGGVMALLGLGFAAATAPALVIATSVSFNLIGAIYVVALNIYATELFPTALRASVSSSVWAVNRIASTLAPLALLPLLKSSGAMAMFVIIAAALVCSVALILIFSPRGLAGKPVK